VLDPYEEKKQQTQETELKIGHSILRRKTPSRGWLQRKSGGKPPHSTTFCCSTVRTHLYRKRRRLSESAGTRTVLMAR
jgi:hypothetical protein